MAEPTRPQITTKKTQVSLCDTVPIEIWYTVMSFLPLSQLSRLSKVSRLFRRMVTQHSLWNEIIKRAGLSNRIPEEGRQRQQQQQYQLKFYDAILSRYSKYICEFCGIYCARKMGAMMNLPVIIHSVDMIVSLCRDCRVHHFKRFPEPERDKSQLMLPIYSAMVEYALTVYDLKHLAYVYSENDHVKHYKQVDVFSLARTVHGGEIGIARALMCSLNSFRIVSVQHTKIDIGGSCSREYARKKLIQYRCESRGLRIDHGSDVYQQYILLGVGSVEATLLSFERS
ncbi:hypothetical protein BD770DRAFT_376570 [Pilaira anomala]|nr:hypothetical protein BD770DRAFT_376570 [Pilaira anomala]